MALNRAWEQLDDIDEPMDEGYFTPKTIREDFQMFADLWEKEIEDLTMADLKHAEATFENGETISGQAYVYRYGVVMDLAETVKESKKIEGDILVEMKMVAVQGVLWDELDLEGDLTTKDPEYFTKKNLRADLKAFAEDAGTTIKELTIKRHNRVLCQSSEELYFDTYINRVSKVLFGLGAIETTNNRSTILKKIKRHLGYKVPEDMDLLYFTQPTIEADIRRFARKIGKVVGFLTQSHNEQTAKCVNGESIQFLTYCHRLGKAWGYGESKNEVKPHLNEIIDTAQEIAGRDFDKITYEYLTEENVRADLEAFAKANNVLVENLNLNHYKKALCQNRLKMTFDRYLFWVGKALDYGDSYLEYKPYSTEVIDKLKNFIGIETKNRKKYPKMDWKYFNQENIRKDLESWAKACESPVEDVRSNWATKSFKACNGENVNVQTYLDRAGRVFGFYSKGKIVTKNNFEIIKFLKRLVGIQVETYSPMDADYFNDLNILRADLLSFALKAKKESLEELFANQMSLHSVTCTNGEKINGSTYISRAGAALGFYKNIKQASLHRGEIFNELKRKLGVKIFEEMDENYFTQENVKYDFEAFANELGVRVEDMYQSHMLVEKTVCSNGEAIYGRTLIARAAKAFDYANNHSEARKCVKKTFTKLKQIANA